jgi:hypothetical protein
VRNRLEHVTDKGDRVVRVGKREEDERRKGEKGRVRGKRGKRIL